MARIIDAAATAVELERPDRREGVEHDADRRRGRSAADRLGRRQRAVERRHAAIEKTAQAIIATLRTERERVR
jgi:hypothetical protein